LVRGDLGTPVRRRGAKSEKSEVATLFSEKVKRNARRKILFVIKIIRIADVAQPL